MKLMKKMMAVVLAVMIAFAATACSNVGNWILKTEEQELPVGIYIAYLQSAYINALYRVEDYTKSPIGQTVEIDEEEIDAEQWILDETMKGVKKLLTVIELCEETGVKLTDEEEKALINSVDSAWTSNGASYEQMGVSKDSLRAIQRFSRLSEKYFESIYGNEGTKAISDEEVKAYFTEKFSSVKYFSVALTDSSGEKLGTEDKEKIENELNNVKEDFEKGEKTFSELVDEYNEKHSTATVKANDIIADLKADYSEEFYKNFINTKAGKGTVFEYNNYMYLVVSYDIEKETDYLEDNAMDIRHTMKDEEYTKMVDEECGKRTFTVNEAAVNKYSPKWMESVLG